MESESVLKVNHQHSLIKAYLKDPPKIESDLGDWLVDVVEAIDMKVLMGPYCKYLDVEGNRGITGIIVIETSHLSCHFWDEISPALLQMDVYSCKEFDIQKVIEKINYFNPTSINFLNIDRNNEFKVA